MEAGAGSMCGRRFSLPHSRVIHSKVDTESAGAGGGQDAGALAGAAHVAGGGRLHLAARWGLPGGRATELGACSIAVAFWCRCPCDTPVFISLSFFLLCQNLICSHQCALIH